MVECTIISTIFQQAEGISTFVNSLWTLHRYNFDWAILLTHSYIEK